jgi:DNA-binding LytR/AlgR family response regulator
MKNKQTSSVVIVQGNLESAYQLRQFLFENDFQNVNIYDDPVRGIEFINIQQPDILFLDVDIAGEFSGVDILRIIHASKLHTHIIAISDTTEKAASVIHFSPIDYLLKPVQREELKVALNKVNAHVFMHSGNGNSSNQKEKHELIVVNSNQEVNYYRTSNLVYIQADGSYSHLYLANGKSDTVCQNIGKLFEKLPSGFFVRVSRKIIVNVDCIRKLDKKTNELWLEFGDNRVKVKASKKYLTNLFA